MRERGLLVLLLVPSVALAQRGVPTSGFPSWQERMVLVLTNRARADPTKDTPACTAAGPSAPLGYVYNFNRSARFHSSNLRQTGQFQHASPCTLVSNISSLFAPNGTCDGAASCACVGGTATCSSVCTATFARIALFGTSANAENIAMGYGSPSAVTQGWLDSSGHCTNMLNGNLKGMGVGWDNAYWTQNFGNGSQAGVLIAGGHEPQMSGSSVAFRVNYYDPGGAALSAQLNVDGTCSAMALERGGASNATYLATQTLSGTSCRRYQFVFQDSSGARVLLPETGSYGVGGSVAGCPDYSAAAPPACPGGIAGPPSVVLDEPVAGAQLWGRVWLKASATDDGAVAKVAFLWDGVVLGEDLLAPYELEVDTALVGLGAHTVQAQAVDLAGDTGLSEAVGVTVVAQADLLAPTVKLLRPSEGDGLQGEVLLSAEASDEGGVASVRFEVDGLAQGTLSAPPWSVVVPAGVLAVGSHSVVAFAVDAAGNQAFSELVRFEVLSSDPAAAGGCGCGPKGRSGAMPLLLVALAFLARRFGSRWRRPA